MEDRRLICQPPARQHALDNLRALMMWLGIVLHVAVIHMAREALLPWRDEQRTPLADLVTAFIHAFRMPVFFILAGFFVALLVQSRGPGGMARHRLKRLGLPFLVFWAPVFTITGVLGLLFVHRMVRGNWGLDPALIPPSPTVPVGPSTMHMWFLWMLLWLSLLTAAVTLRQGGLTRRGLAAAGTLLQRLGAAWWGPLLLALPLVATGWAYPNGLIRPSGQFLPPPAEWLHNGLFFAFGLALFHQQWDLFALYRRRWGAYGAAGLVFFLASGALIEYQAAAGWIAFSYNAAAWLWSFAAIGLALRFLGQRSALLAYLADSSYWVYLVHMPLTIGFGALLYGLDWSALSKMGINIAATSLVCLASYQFFVRSTWVGALLNGKRRRKSSPGVLAHASH